MIFPCNYHLLKSCTIYLLYFSFLYEYMTYVYVIFICLVHLLHPTVTQLPGFTIEWNQLWCSINICWMNEFSNFCAFAQTYHWCLTCNESSRRDLPAGGAGEAKSLRSQCKGPGLIPGQGTRSHMPQLRVCMPHLKTLRAPIKDPACVCACMRVSRSVVSNSLDPTDCSPLGSSVHGILQARILEWVTVSSSRGSSGSEPSLYIQQTRA